MKNIQYYNQNSKSFIENTKDADMSKIWDAFEQHLEKGSLILDVGCGSGRDSMHFLSRGYKVYAFDGSIKMVNYCKDFLKDGVIYSTFEEFQTDQKFDGIWACASFIHIEEGNLIPIIKKFAGFLKEEGVFFMSFKEREENYEKDGRYFTCLNRIKLKDIMNQLDDLEVLEIIHTVDVREGREDEKWLSIIFKAIPMSKI